MNRSFWRESQVQVKTLKFMSDSVDVKNSTVPAMAALHSYPDYHALQEDIEADHVFSKISSSYNMAGIYSYS